MKIIVLVSLMSFCVSFSVNAQQSVISITIPIDTSQAQKAVGVFGGDADSIFAVPNGAAYDVYNRLTGKIASVSINKQPKVFTTTTTLFRAGNTWLSLHTNYDTTGLWGASRKYRIYSNIYNGTTLMFNDTSRITPVYSGSTCYLSSSIPFFAGPPPDGDKYASGNYSYKLWKIENVTAPGAQLTKKSVVRQTQTTMVPNGLKIITHNNSDGTTLVQIFDISGRLTYSGAIPNDKPSIIPAASLPNSPFVVDINGAGDNLRMKIK